MRRIFQHSRNRSDASGSLSQADPQTPTDDGYALDQYHDVGVSSDCNKRYRKTMEDTHKYILGYLGIPGCAYTAIFDGHAGVATARFCNEHLHDILAVEIRRKPSRSIPECMAEAFREIDRQLEENGITHSGCTAVVAVTGFVAKNGRDIVPATATGGKRTVFVANVGDAAAILCSHKQRKCLKLTYDHRGSDPHEQRRVQNAGGIIMANRVNGMLAVTRSLGDLSMKDYVLGDPYTTETIVEAGDTLVLACDGIWDVMSGEQVVSTVESTKDRASRISSRLLENALAAFTTDNVTVLVAKLL